MDLNCTLQWLMLSFQWPCKTSNPLPDSSVHSSDQCWKKSSHGQGQSKQPVPQCVMSMALFSCSSRSGVRGDWFGKWWLLKPVPNCSHTAPPTSRKATHGLSKILSTSPIKADTLEKERPNHDFFVLQDLQKTHKGSILKERGAYLCIYLSSHPSVLSLACLSVIIYISLY